MSAPPAVKQRACFAAAARDFSFMPALADADNVLYETIKQKVLNSQVQMKKTESFTMVELLVVIFIVAILTVIGTPLIRGRINSSKWSEAETGAATIRAAVRTYIAEKGVNYNYSDLEGSLDDRFVYESLGFSNTDLNGRYFVQADCNLSNVSAHPSSCVITVTSSAVDGPPGTGTLAADGTWSVAD
jgi:type II secretory pathway pseudopilin PulG